MPPYLEATQEGQLIVADGRILALSDSGQFIRVHALDNGRELSRPLSTHSNDWNVVLRVSGPHLYVIGQKSVVGYNLEQPQQTWSGTMDQQAALNMRDGFVGQRHLVLLDQPAAGLRVVGGQVQSVNRLHAYALYAASKANPAESGRLDYVHDITHPAGIVQWQAVEGGFCYVSGDQRLHMLMGSGE
jgi:hypothetical protein